MTGNRDVADVLVESGVLDREQLEKARAAAHSKGLPIERAVLALDLASEPDVYRAVAKAAGMKFVDPTRFKLKPELLDLLRVLDAWGPCPDPPLECPADLDGNGDVGIDDFLDLLAAWG